MYVRIYKNRSFASDESNYQSYAYLTKLRNQWNVQLVSLTYERLVWRFNRDFDDFRTRVIVDGPAIDQLWSSYSSYYVSWFISFVLFTRWLMPTGATAIFLLFFKDFQCGHFQRECFSTASRILLLDSYEIKMLHIIELECVRYVITRKLCELLELLDLLERVTVERTEIYRR